MAAQARPLQHRSASSSGSVFKPYQPTRRGVSQPPGPYGGHVQHEKSNGGYSGQDQQDDGNDDEYAVMDEPDPRFPGSGGAGYDDLQNGPPASGRFLDNGGQTRSSSFSGVESRTGKQLHTLPSHQEESYPTNHRSPSPFPTAFSDTSSPPTSPPTSSQARYAHPNSHSPPAAEPGASRSRSQSLAPGLSRPNMMMSGIGIGGGGNGMHGLNALSQLHGQGGGYNANGSGGGRGLHRDSSPWGNSPGRTGGMELSSSPASSGYQPSQAVYGNGNSNAGQRPGIAKRSSFLDRFPAAPDASNMSPFSRDLNSIISEGQHLPARTPFGSVQDSATPSWLNQRRELVASAVGVGQGMTNNGPSALEQSVQAALGGGSALETSSEHGEDDMDNESVVANGGPSGTSSRRHSVSVVGGMGFGSGVARRGFALAGYGFTDGGAATSGGGVPIGGSRGGGERAVMGVGSMYGSSLRASGRGASGPGGFSDEDFLVDGLTNTLNLHARPPLNRRLSSSIRDHSTSPAGRGVSSGSPGQRDGSTDRSRFDFAPSSLERSKLSESMGNGGSPNRLLSIGTGMPQQQAPSKVLSGTTPTSNLQRVNMQQSQVSSQQQVGSIGGPGPQQLNPAIRASGFNTGLQTMQPTLQMQGFHPPAGLDSRMPSFLPQGLLSPEPYHAPVRGRAPVNQGYGQQAMQMGGMQPRAEPFSPMMMGQILNQNMQPAMQLHHATSPYGINMNLPPVTMLPSSFAQPPGYMGAIGSSPAPMSSQALGELGKGVSLGMIPPGTTLYLVEFKGQRRDLFYPSMPMRLGPGDMCIVEGDRGQDLGTVAMQMPLDDVRAFAAKQRHALAQIIPGKPSDGILSEGASADATLAGMLAGVHPEVQMTDAMKIRYLSKEIMPKRIFSKATVADQQLLLAKQQDEAQALALCQSKVKQRNLPMEVIDAEYQWDRRKLTFYYSTDRRVDFRELCRELFRLYKTRIWMSCLGGNYMDDEM